MTFLEYLADAQWTYLVSVVALLVPWYLALPAKRGEDYRADWLTAVVLVAAGWLLAGLVFGSMWLVDPASLQGVGVGCTFVGLPLSFLVLAVAAGSSGRRRFRIWAGAVFAAHVVYAITLVTLIVSRDQLRFFSPDAFWLLAFVPLFVYAWWRSQALMTGVRRGAALVLRLILLGLLVIAAADPQVVTTQDGMAVVFVVDRSVSMPPRLVDDWYVRWINQQLQQIPAERHAKDQFAVVVFAGNAALLKKLSPGGSFEVAEPSTLGHDVTDLAAAVRKALAIFPDDRRKRVVLLTDGNANRGDVLGDLRLARHYGVTFDVVEIRGGDQRRDIRIERLDSPGEVKLGQRFEPRLVIWSNNADDVRVRLNVTVNGVPETMPEAEAARLQRWQAMRDELLARVPLTPDDEAEANVLESKIAELRAQWPSAEYVVKPGRNYPVLPARRYETPGFFELRVEVLADEKVDEIPQNNSGSAFTIVRGKRRLLFAYGDTLAANAGYIAELRAVFETEAARTGDAPPSIDIVDSSRMPRSLAEWRQYDGVILSNVPAMAWKDEQQRTLVSAIHRFGTGLLMLGGDKSYGAGGYADQPLVEALPVKMEIQQAEHIPAGALVIVLHTCEFADANAHTKKMCEAALDALTDRDQLGIVLYDYTANNAGASWLFKLQPIGGMREAMRGRIARAMPGDMPSFAPAFAEAYKALQASKAMAKHCVVISDGDPSQPSFDLVGGAFKVSGITTSSIVVMPHQAGALGQPGGEEQTMIEIAKRGGNLATWQTRYYPILQLNRLNTLPQIFTREAIRVRTPLIMNGDFVPLIASQAEFLQAIIASGAGVPQFQGYVAVTPRPLAQQALRLRPAGQGQAESQPLLVYWQHGLGRVMCFTSDVTNPGWCSHWATRWAGYRRFWGDIVNWFARQARDDDDRVAMITELMDGRGHVMVQAIDPSGAPLLLDKIDAVAIDPAQNAHPITLRMVEPGTYEAWFDAPSRGAWQIRMHGEAGMSNEQSRKPFVLTGGISVPYAREYRDMVANTGLLATIAQQTGGKLVRGDLLPVGSLGGTNEIMPERIFGDAIVLDPVNDDRPLRDPTTGAPMPYNAFANDLPLAPAFEPIWQPFAIAALVLLLVDVFFRKVFVSWSQVTDLVAPAVASVPLLRRLFELRAQTPVEQMQRLRAVKQAVAARQLGERDRRAHDAGDVLAALRQQQQQTRAAPPPPPPPPPDADFKKHLHDRAKRTPTAPPPAEAPAAPPPPKPDDKPARSGSGGLFDRLRDAKRDALDDRDKH